MRFVDRDELLRVLKAFERVGLDYILIGAVAMAYHGVIRATEDVDVMIAPSPENVARLRAALREAFPGDPNIEEIRDEDLIGEYSTVRYYPPGDGLYIDVLTRLGEAASYETIESEWKNDEGIRVRVATARALFELKKDTTRPIDQQDAAMLAQILEPERES